MIWVTLTVLNGVALISSFFTEKLSLDRLLNTKQGVDRGTSDMVKSTTVETVAVEAKNDEGNVARIDSAGESKLH
jgi:hypothetical protein